MVAAAAAVDSFWAAVVGCVLHAALRWQLMHLWCGSRSLLPLRGICCIDVWACILLPGVWPGAIQQGRVHG